jgi:hypothetical protein
MFGDARVCASSSSGSACVPRPSAYLWNTFVNHKMSEIGHCAGMAATSVRFFYSIGQSPSESVSRWGQTLSVNAGDSEVEVCKTRRIDVIERI